MKRLTHPQNWHADHLLQHMVSSYFTEVSSHMRRISNSFGTERQVSKLRNRVFDYLQLLSPSLLKKKVEVHWCYS